jgi:hypothetical protein
MLDPQRPVEAGDREVLREVQEEKSQHVDNI